MNIISKTRRAVVYSADNFPCAVGDIVYIRCGNPRSGIWCVKEMQIVAYNREGRKLLRLASVDLNQTLCCWRTALEVYHSCEAARGIG